MQFKAATDEINYGLNMVTRAIAARPARQVYEGVMIETPGTGIRLTCTDGEMTIKTAVNAIIAKDGVSVMPAKLMSELIRRLSDGEVDIKIDQNARAAIRSRGSSTNMVGMTAEDFPDIHDVVPGNVVVLPASKLRDAISKIMFAVSTDETRKILTGVLIETTATETRLVGLDGFRLAMQRIQAENTLPEGTDLIKCVVPGRVLNELSKILPDDESIPCTLTYSKSHIMAEFGSVKLYTTLLTGEFIDYKRILPTEWQTEIILGRRMFSDAIERCGLMAREGKNNLIYLDITDSKMLMTSAAERGDVQEELDIGFSGTPLRIAFNSRFLTDVIRNIDSDEIRMCFNSSVSPCVIRPAEGDKYTFLVLPVRTFNSK